MRVSASLPLSFAWLRVDNRPLFSIKVNSFWAALSCSHSSNFLLVLLVDFFLSASLSLGGIEFLLYLLFLGASPTLSQFLLTLTTPLLNSIELSILVFHLFLVGDLTGKGREVIKGFVFIIRL